MIIYVSTILASLHRQGTGLFAEAQVATLDSHGYLAMPRSVIVPGL